MDRTTGQQAKRTPRKGRGRRRGMAAAILASALALLPQGAMADEGGVSFWVPGFFGSLAAVPQQPGWSLATIYYHTSVKAGADVALAREFQVGRVPANLSANLNANLKATADLGFVMPSYVFATPVLGGQASIGVIGSYGTSSASLAGTLSGTLGNAIRQCPVPALRQHQRHGMGFHRSGPDILTALERRRAQLHDLHHRRHTGRRL